MAIHESITLKEVQLRLGVPQHVLIHLCEKGVIAPDFAETEGRGKRREFSQRNLFEFGLALTLREFELSVATTAFIVRLLRSFERAMKKVLADFVLPGFLIEQGIDLSLHLYDGRRLIFDARGGNLRKPLLLGVTVTDASREAGARPRLEKLDELPRLFEARLELDLTRIARRLGA
jgi:DNA-binding transcriptional MerR regulator